MGHHHQWSASSCTTETFTFSARSEKGIVTNLTTANTYAFTYTIYGKANIGNSDRGLTNKIKASTDYVFRRFVALLKQQTATRLSCKAAHPVGNRF